jgi:CheY-like chemotaxis protein/class 3 adenylate cyclase
MDTPNWSMDLRIYRPTAVVVIDLVKHSTRDKAAIHTVQVSMAEILENAKQILKVEESYFNYTGDGYVCALVGDSSARLMDFLNAVIPALKLRLNPHGQEMRVGVDFGLIHFVKNSLTGKHEYFDAPSIQAARLEQAAKPGQILCTETVHHIFSRHYAQMFSTSLMQISTKDRVLPAFEVTPFDARERVRGHLSDFFFGISNAIIESGDKRKKFLLVDDEEAIREVVAVLLRAKWPDFEVVTARNGREALVLFRPGEFAAVFADMVMPEMDGVTLTQRLTDLDSELPIIMVTAFHDEEAAKPFFTAGGSYLLLKPFQKEDLENFTTMALACQPFQAIRTELGLLCDDLGSFLLLLHNTSEQFRLILKDCTSVRDRAAGLLRHQAKHAVMNFLSRIGPGCDAIGLLKQLKAQLLCVFRLSAIVKRQKAAALETYLQDVISDFQVLNPDIEFMFDCAVNVNELGKIQDGSLLVLIISELIDNAISALEGRGKIETKIRFLRGSGSFQISVRDSGTGVPVALVGTIFDAGVSTKGPGRGLGLSLVRDAVRWLGGTIHYEYRNGATFRFVIPTQMTD